MGLRQSPPIFLVERLGLRKAKHLADTRLARGTKVCLEDSLLGQGQASIIWEGQRAQGQVSWLERQCYLETDEA